MNTATGYLDESESDESRSLIGEFDLQSYLRLLRKFKWPIALFTAAVTAIAIYYVSTATPIYNATSTLLIEDQGGDPIPIGELIGVDTPKVRTIIRRSTSSFVLAAWPCVLSII